MARRRPSRLAAAALAILPVLAGACAGNERGPEARTLLVFAAASLSDVMEELAAAFEEEHAGVSVQVNLAGSQQLARQILEGAPADVLVTAGDRWMDEVVDAGLARDPRVVAGNRLEIAVEPGNPLGIAGLEDLGRDDVLLVVAAGDVPAGAATRRALELADVEVTPVSLEQDVRAVLAKVALGEADAGVVYHSDVVAADAAVDGVPLPEAHQVRVDYPLAVLDGASDPSTAAAFAELVDSPAGRRALADAGFEVAS